MRFSSFIPILFLAISCCFAADEPFVAFHTNGDKKALKSVSNLLSTFPHHSDGRKLLEGDNPIRSVQRKNGEVEFKAPFVQMANGDILPGSVVSWRPAPASGFPPAHFVVQPQQWALSTPAEIRVKQSQVKRIVWRQSRSSVWKANQIIANDGRTLAAAKIAFTERGLRALGDFGVGQSRFATLTFAELAELHLATQPTENALAADGLLAVSCADDWLQTVGDRVGGRYTQPVSRTRVNQEKQPGRDAGYIQFTQLQPTWSLDPIAIDLENVLKVSYRRPDELPLSSLPTEEGGAVKSLHRWQWRRDANVAGDPLAVGEQTYATGYGVHASQALLVSLPPGAKSISGSVGIDRSVGGRGCIKAMLRRESNNGAELWKSDFIRGGQTPATFTNINVQGAKTIALVADAAATDFPDNADPLDIGDHVDWLAPLVTVDLNSIHQQTPYDQWLPALAGWKIQPEDHSRLKLQNFWNEQTEEWQIALDIDFHGDLAEKPFRLTRRETISLGNAYFYGKMTRSDDSNGSHLMAVEINGEPQKTTMNGGLSTTYARKNRTNNRSWIFSEHAGKEVELALVLRPDAKKSSKHPDPVAIIEASLQPLVQNLPSTGKPISPTIPLETLKPTATENLPGDYVLEAGKLSDGEPLALQTWPMAHGIGVPTGSRLTYKLDPKWRRFVAVIGLAEGSTAAGPYQVVVDGDILWESVEPSEFGRNTPGQQIDVAIPEGSKEMILKVDGREAFGAWAYAGFMQE